jgi:hypothetical protein
MMWCQRREVRRCLSMAAMLQRSPRAQGGPAARARVEGGEAPVQSTTSGAQGAAHRKGVVVVISWRISA